MHGVALAPTEPLSPEWHEQRKRGIGSSDAPAVCALSPWRSPFDVWLDKSEDIPDSDTAAMRWGRYLEAPVADAFADESGFTVGRVPCAFAHPDYPWMQANPDRLLWEPSRDPAAEIPDALLEVKTAGFFSRDEWKDGVPDHYRLQVQHQLAVMGMDRAFVAVLIAGRDFRWFEIERAEGLVSNLIAVEQRFWFEHVVAGVPPEPGGGDRTSDALDRLYAEVHEGEICDLPDEAADVLQQYALAQRIARDATKDKDQLANKIKLWLGNAEVGALEGRPVVTWKRSGSKRTHNCPDCVHERDEIPRRLTVKK